MVNKHFYVQDRLALVLDEWGNQIDSIAFVYTSAGQGKRTVMKSAPESLYYLLKDKIDAETTLTVHSYGHLEGCVDAIVVSTELERAKAAYENKVEVFNYWNGKLEEMMKALYSKASAE